VVTGDFVVAFDYISTNATLAYDENLNNGRSWDHSSLSGLWSANKAYLIRAIVQYSSGEIEEGKVFGEKNLFPIIKSLSSINEIENAIKNESTILGLDRKLGWYYFLKLNIGVCIFGKGA